MGAEKGQRRTGRDAGDDEPEDARHDRQDPAPVGDWGVSTPVGGLEGVVPNLDDGPPIVD